MFSNGLLKLGRGTYGQVVVDPKDSKKAMKIANIFEGSSICAPNIREVMFGMIHLCQHTNNHLVSYTSFNFQGYSACVTMQRHHGDLGKWATETPYSIRMLQVLQKMQKYKTIPDNNILHSHSFVMLFRTF
jgi:hypothetical protein